MRPILAMLTLAALLAAPARAQFIGAEASSAPAAGVPLSTQPAFGIPLKTDQGPWVLGDVRFVGGLTVSEYALQSKVRARRGSLYTPSDVLSDVNSLLGMGVFTGVRTAVYAVPEDPVPEQYAALTVSTSMVRLVFTLEERPGQAPAQPQVEAPKTSTRPEDRVPPAAVSGVILTPTAYRGLGRHNRPGLGLDFNAVYYIGRLYGKNHLSYTTKKTNYIDRVGQWFLGADGKMQLQSETRWRPAMAVGAQGIFAFRDAPQPSITTPGVTVNVSQKATKALADAYFVVSKKIGPVRSSVGYMQGNAGDQTASLTEFLSPTALRLGGHSGGGLGSTEGQVASSKSVFFGSLLLLPKPAYPLAVEFIKPNGMPLQPFLINFKLGYFLKLNFDIAYLKFAGGWDLLGMFQFRFNYFPRN